MRAAREAVENQMLLTRKMLDEIVRPNPDRQEFRQKLAVRDNIGGEPARMVVMGHEIPDILAGFDIERLLHWVMLGNEFKKKIGLGAFARAGTAEEYYCLRPHYTSSVTYGKPKSNF